MVFFPKLQYLKSQSIVFMSESFWVEILKIDQSRMASEKLVYPSIPL